MGLLHSSNHPVNDASAHNRHIAVIPFSSIQRINQTFPADTTTRKRTDRETVANPFGRQSGRTVILNQLISKTVNLKNS
jgi:hypothetical protein